MAFYSEHDLPGFPDPSRRRAAARVGYFDTAISALAFLQAYPGHDDFEIAPDSLSQQFLIPEGLPAERKARAGEIAAKLGAVTEWHSGYYMARLHALQIHFYPPILLADMSGDDATEAA